MRCDEVVDQLPGIIDAGIPADARLQAHVEGCLRCQAELVQYRRLLKALHQLRTQVLEPAPGLLSDILATIEEVGERRAARSLINGRNAAYAGGIAAATAAGAVGAILIAHRARVRRFPLAG